MTTANSLSSKPGPFKKSISLKRNHSVFRASRHISARRRKEWRNILPIKLDDKKGNCFWNENNLFEKTHFHHTTSNSASCFLIVLTRSSCFARAIFRRAKNTTSCPVQGAPSSRATSLISLLHLLLRGAVPNFFPAIKAHLPKGESVFDTSIIVTRDEEERLPVWKRRSISSLRLIVPFTLCQPI